MSDEKATGSSSDGAGGNRGTGSEGTSPKPAVAAENTGATEARPAAGGDGPAARPGKAPVRKPQAGRGTARKTAGEATPQPSPRRTASKRGPARKTAARKAPASAPEAATSAEITGTTSADMNSTDTTSAGTEADSLTATPAAPVAPAPEVPDQVLAQVDEVQAQEDAAAKKTAGSVEPVRSELEAEDPTAPNPTAPKPAGAIAADQLSPDAAVAAVDAGTREPTQTSSASGVPEVSAAMAAALSTLPPEGDGVVKLAEPAASPQATELPKASETSVGPADVPKKKPAPAVSAAATLPGAKGSQGAGYARDRFAMMVGARVLRKEKLPYADALEIGAGATFGFSLGLLQSGVVGRLWISDLATSALVAARRRSEHYGLRLQGDELADPELLPFPEGKFDLVVAHALLHRRMDPANTLTEMLRVLKPGGRFVITGESTRAKDWASPGFARAQGSVGRVGMSRAGKARTRLPERLRALTGAPDAPVPVPDQLQALALEAGAREVKVKPEELLATVLPYPGAEPAPVVTRSRQRLSMVDRKLSQVLPPSAFPTVGITGIR